MQASAEPQPATAPAEAPAAPVTVTTVGPDGKPQTLTIPRTIPEVEQLRGRRDELSSQLASVASRRRGLSDQILAAPDGASRTGLESRIRLLDQRILQLETDLAATGRQLALVPADLVGYTQGPPSGGDDFAEGMAAGVFSLLSLLAVVAVYRRFGRRRNPKPSANLANDSAQRLERVENAVEAIALEIERVGEGQRFVTRLLSEQAPLAGARRIAEPAPIEQGGQASR